MLDDGDGGKRVRQQRISTMLTTAAELQEERCGRVGWENVNRVLLSIMTAADPMAQSPSHAKERPTNNWPVQSIGHRRASVVTVS